MNDTKKGSDRVRASIKKNTFAGALVGFLFLAAGVAMTIPAFSNLGGDGMDDSDITYIVFGAIFALIGLIVFIPNLLRFIDPDRSKAVRTNPGLYEMADEHFSNIRYKDKIVTISDKYISCTKKPYQLAALTDVYQVYFKLTRYMLVITLEKLLMFRCGPVDFRVNVWGTSRKKVDECTRNVALSCPNAKFGFTPDNNSYANEMCRKWKSEHKAK